MRSITAALRAKAQSLAGQAYVRVSIANERPRWDTLHTLTSATDTRTDLCSDNDGTLYHVRVDGSGNVQLCTISSPTTLAQWNTWTTIAAADAVVYGDVAIEHMGGNNLRVAYVGSPYRIKVKESTDLGANWGAAVTIITGLTASPSVALSANSCFLWGGGFLMCYESVFGSGSWAGPYNWTGTDSHTLIYGIAAVTHSTKQRLLYAADGIMYTGSYDEATNTFSSRYQIQPGADQTATTKADPTVPSTVAPDEVIATWVEDYAGTPAAWKYPIQRTAPDADAIHYGPEVTMCEDSVTDNRLALAYDSSTHIIYAANEQVVLFSPIYQSSDSAMHIGPLIVSKYDLHAARMAPGRLDLEFIDQDGDYRGIGRSGETAEAIKPLSILYLRRGYFTTSDEYETLDPYYIIEARRTENKDGGRFNIRAVDGIGLMATYHPPETLTFINRSVEWLLDELAAKVGLTVSNDANAAFSRTIADFSLHPSQSAALAFRTVLRYAGAIVRIDEDGILQCYYLDTYAPASKPDVGDKSEILQAEYGVRAHEATSVRVISESIASEGEDIAASQLMGTRLFLTIEDYRITAQNVADCVRDRELALADAHARYETVTIHLRPDIELYDTITLYANTDAIPAADRERDIIAIRERWDVDRARFEQTLTLDAS